VIGAALGSGGIPVPNHRNCLGGFPPGEVFDAGFFVVVTPDGDLNLARQTAETISGDVWEWEAMG